MKLSRFETIDKLPDVKDHGMHDTAFRIGCVGCRADCAGVYLVDGDKDGQQDLLATLELASMETGVPITVATDKRPNPHTFGEEDHVGCVDINPCHAKSEFLNGVKDTIRIAARNGTPVRFV